MKPIHFVSMLLVVTLFVACTQRVELRGAEQSTSSGTVMVTFGAELSNFDALRLRAGATSTELQSNLGRLTIDGIRIVLYKQDESGQPTEVAYVFQKDAKIFKGKISGSDQIEIDPVNRSISIAGTEEIEIGDYSVYFFTSPSQSLKAATEVGMSFAALKENMTYDYRTVSEGVSNLGFNLYTNVDNPLSISSADLSNNSTSTPYRIQATKLSSVNAQIYINFPNDLAVGALKYNPANRMTVFFDAQNRKFNLFPQFDTADFDTPLGGQSSFRIPIDPNYEGFSSKTLDELSSEFIYLEKSRGTAYLFFPHQDANGENYVMPIAENTLSSQEANGKVTTRIIVGIPMEPTEKTIQPDSYGAKSFVLYKNEVLSVAELKLKYDNALAASPRTPQQEEVVAEVQKMNAFAQKTGTPADGTNLILPTQMGYESPLLKYFCDGVVYYELPSRHYGDAQVSDRLKPGRFGIVRNTLYLYNILSLTQVGVANPLALAEERDYNYNSTTKAAFGLSLSDMSVVETDLNL